MTKYANDHPYKLVVGKGDGIYANDHPYLVEIDGGVVTPEEFEELETKVDALATDLSYKGGVPTYEDLPTNPETGDVYTTEDTGILYVWDSAKWVPLNKSQAAITGTDAPTTATEGELGQAYLDTTHQKIYYLAQITSDPTTYIWKAYGPEVVQTVGDSTTDVMSQKAVTDTINAQGIKTLTEADYNYPTTGTKNSIAIWLLAPGVYRAADVNVRFIVADNVPYYGVNLLVVPEGGTTADKVGLLIGNYTSTGINGTGIIWKLKNEGTGIQEIAYLRPQDSLISSSTVQPLSANQGRVLKGLIDALDTPFTGTDGTADGAKGLVPAPTTADADKFLKADGTWGEAGGGIRTLTTADYDYPTNNPTMINGNALADGFYIAGEQIKVCKDIANAFDNYQAGGILIKSDGSFLKHLGATQRWSFQTSFYDYGSSNLLDIGNIAHNLTTTDASKVLDATQGKVLNEKIVGTTETATIATTDWTALTDSDPYDYSATITATATIDANTGVVELLNDQPALFGTYGFAIGAVSGQSVTIYSIGQPDASVSLKLNIRNL